MLPGDVTGFTMFDVKTGEKTYHPGPVMSQLLLADEPTGALDSKTGRLVMDLFHTLHKKQGKTIVLITHNYQLATETDRIITLSDGRIIPNGSGEVEA